MSKKSVKGTMTVFVYGTLLQGLRNHHVMSSDSRCVLVGKAITRKAKFLVHNGAYPAILHEHFKKDLNHEKFKVHVLGEIWRVPIDVVRNKLDYLEGYNPASIAKSFYVREFIQLIELETGKVKRASVYVLPSYKASSSMQHLCEKGDYRQYAE